MEQTCIAYLLEGAIQVFFGGFIPVSIEASGCESFI